MTDYRHIIGSPGYVFGFTLDGDGHGTPLGDSANDDQMVWIHLDYSHDDSIPLLQELGVPEVAIEILVRPDSRPRTMVKREGTILILRGVNLNPGNNPEDMVSLRFWIENNRLITMRQRRVQSAREIRLALEIGKGPENLHDLILAIIESMADRISDYVNQLEENIAEHEANIEEASAAALRRDIADIRRQAAAVRRYLAPQRDALDIFYLQAKSILTEEDALYIHEQSDRIIRNVEDLDLVREKALLLQDELLNRLAQDQAARMYVLSVVSAIFMPITFLTGVFGMNVAGLPGLTDPRSFYVVLGFTLLVGSGIVFLLHRKKWL
ncbi:MAG: zinc transporter ZntB [Pseudomonadota bacterium]